MPFPLILLGVGAALFGVKALSDSSDAKDINKEANDIVNEAKRHAEGARKSCGMDLKKLGSTKMDILNTSVKHFVRSFGELKNVNFRGSGGLNEMNRLRLSSGELAELREMGDLVGYSAVTALSVGMASTAVLGGLVAGPALAIMGLVVGSKASAAKDEAYSNLAKAKKIAEELNLAVDLSNAISKKCRMFVDLLERLNGYFVPMLDKMDRAIEQHGADYSKFSLTQQEQTAIAVSLAKAIKTVLDTPILDKNGNMTSASDDVLNRIKPMALANGRCFLFAKQVTSRFKW